MQTVHKLQDIHQKAWALASIQLAGFTSLPILATSTILLAKYQFTSTVITLLLGNLILGLIRYFMIIMSDRTRKSTLDIAIDYLGPAGAYPVGLVLLLATIAWYETQTTLSTNSIFFLLPINSESDVSVYIQICILFGVIGTLLCMEGIVAIRRLCVSTFPISLLLMVIVIYMGPMPEINWSFSNFTLAGLPLVVGTNLGVTADIPTFFRHSASRRESIKALVYIQVLSLILSLVGLFFISIIEPWFGIDSQNILILQSDLLRWTLLALIFISTINANVANIYSASVAWEVVVPILAGRKELLILGLGLTIISVLFINIFSLDILVDIADSGLVNLTLIFITGYIIHRCFYKKIAFKDTRACLIAWLVGSIFTILNSFEIFLSEYSSILVGCISIIAVLIVYFFVKFINRSFSLKKIE